MFKRILVLVLLCSTMAFSQDYFLPKFEPFNADIPSPEEFLGYGIGAHHTRHDLIVAYLEKLASVSDRASIHTYGKTHEGRKLVILTITTPENLTNLEAIKKEHLAFTHSFSDNKLRGESINFEHANILVVADKNESLSEWQTAISNNITWSI